MFCNKCGNKIPEDASFCVKCGAPLPQGAASESQAWSEPAATPAPAVSPSGVEQAPVSPAVSRGCFGSGWDDVRNTDGLPKRLALMALIDLVPILNWVNTGYGWNWAKDFVKGSREGMPDSIVNGDNFKLGFFAFVIGIILAFAIGFEGGILGLVPFVGVLAAIALGVFADMFVSLSYMRIALFGRLGAGFELGKLFDGFKRNLGTLFCVNFVPGVVIAGISLVIWLVYFLIVGVVAGADVMSILAASARSPRYGISSSELAYALSGSIGIAVVLGLIATYANAMAVRFCVLVKQRGLAHFVARNIPEWAGEAGVARPAWESGATIPPNSSLGSAAAYTSGVGVVPPVRAAKTAPATLVSEAVSPATTAPSHATQPTIISMQPEGIPAGEVDAKTAAREASAGSAVALEPVVERTPEAKLVVEPEPKPEPVLTSEPRSVAEAIHQSESVASASCASDLTATVIELPSDQSEQPGVLRLTRANGDSCQPTQFPLVIGTDPHADWVIVDNPKVSRFHVRILHEGGTFLAEDLDSTNKTRIGMSELTAYVPAALSDGDELRLGYAEVLRVSITGA